MNAKWGRHTIYLYRVQYTEENWPEYDSHRKTKMVYILHIYMSHLLAVTEVSNDAEDRFYSNDSVYFSFSQLFSHFLIAINTSRRFYNEKNTVFFCVGDRPSVLRAYHNNGPFKAWTRIIFAFDGPQWFDDKFEARADVNIVVWFFFVLWFRHLRLLWKALGIYADFAISIRFFRTDNPVNMDQFPLTEHGIGYAMQNHPTSSLMGCMVSKVYYNFVHWTLCYANPVGFVWQFDCSHARCHAA